MSAQQSQVAFATPLFYRIDVPYQAFINNDFDPADVRLSVVGSPSRYNPGSTDGQSTFNGNDEKETLRFISIAASLESGRKACELVLKHTPFERIKTLLEKNIEAKGFGWIERELDHLRNLETGRVDCVRHSR